MHAIAANLWSGIAFNGFRRDVSAQRSRLVDAVSPVTGLAMIVRDGDYDMLS
jgi:hypothetical protein